MKRVTTVDDRCPGGQETSTRIALTSTVPGARVIRKAMCFDFEGEHPDHGDQIALEVGLGDDPVEEGEIAVLLFPAVVTLSRRTWMRARLDAEDA